MGVLSRTWAHKGHQAAHTTPGTAILRLTVSPNFPPRPTFPVSTDRQADGRHGLSTPSTGLSSMAGPEGVIPLVLALSDLCVGDPGYDVVVQDLLTHF